MSHEQVVLVNSYANVCDSIMDHTLFMRSILVNLFGSKIMQSSKILVYEDKKFTHLGQNKF